jgi:hypothetical protein
MIPRRPRDGSSMNHRVRSRQSGRPTKNSPNENPSGRSVKNGDIVDRDVTTSEEIG